MFDKWKRDLRHFKAWSENRMAMAANSFIRDSQYLDAERDTMSEEEVAEIEGRLERTDKRVKRYAGAIDAMDEWEKENGSTGCLSLWKSTYGETA